MISLSPPFVDIEIPDPESLLDRARGGDADAFGEICRVHETPLLRQALSLCGNLSLAEDLAQDTLVEAWRCLRRYNGRCRFFTWLCAILLNRYRNTIRSQHSWFRLVPATNDESSTEDVVENLIDPASLPNEEIETREQSELVWRCIRSLPAKHQEVVVLRFYVDDSLEGIAVALGCSLGTVKSRLFHALDKLRSMRLLRGQAGKLELEGKNQ